MNLAEIYYSLLKETDEKTAETVIKQFNFDFLEISQEVIKEAMIFRYQHKKAKLSMTDCIGYILAKRHSLLFLTEDVQFKNKWYLPLGKTLRYLPAIKKMWHL